MIVGRKAEAFSHDMKKGSSQSGQMHRTSLSKIASHVTSVVNRQREIKTYNTAAGSSRDPEI
jgi:hypothetical protein